VVVHQQQGQFRASIGFGHAGPVKVDGSSGGTGPEIGRWISMRQSPRTFQCS
jgi:hypothetical protein